MVSEDIAHTNYYIGSITVQWNMEHVAEAFTMYHGNQIKMHVGEVIPQDADAFVVIPTQHFAGVSYIEFIAELVSEGRSLYHAYGYLWNIIPVADAPDMQHVIPQDFIVTNGSKTSFYIPLLDVVDDTEYISLAIEPSDCAAVQSYGIGEVEIPAHSCRVELVENKYSLGGTKVAIDSRIRKMARILLRITAIKTRIVCTFHLDLECAIGKKVLR